MRLNRLLLATVMFAAITLSGNASAGHRAKKPAFDFLGDGYFVNLSFSKEECYDGRQLVSAHIANENTNRVEAYQFVVEHGCVKKAYIARGEFKISTRFAAFGIIVESDQYTKSLHLIAFDTDNGAREIFQTSRPLDSDSNASIFVSPIRTLGVNDLIVRATTRAADPADTYTGRVYNTERRYQWNGQQYVRGR
jgi:hypothetical protein